MFFRVVMWCSVAPKSRCVTIVPQICTFFFQRAMADGKRRKLTEFFRETRSSQQANAALRVKTQQTGIGAAVLNEIKASIRRVTKPKRRVKNKSKVSKISGSKTVYHTQGLTFVIASSLPPRDAFIGEICPKRTRLKRKWGCKMCLTVRYVKK